MSWGVAANSVKQSEESVQQTGVVLTSSLVEGVRRPAVARPVANQRARDAVARVSTPAHSSSAESGSEQCSQLTWTRVDWCRRFGSWSQSRSPWTPSPPQPCPPGRTWQGMYNTRLKRWQNTYDIWRTFVSERICSYFPRLSPHSSIGVFCLFSQGQTRSAAAGQPRSAQLVLYQTGK